tara:strand:- start:2163 stop:3542 length:1380 start_codon:yes stop_codon:yes gene_type:complete
MKISEAQTHSIYLIKNYFKKLEDSSIDTSKSGQCYFALWSETQGMARMKLWLKGYAHFFSFCLINLKNIFSIASHANYIEISNDQKASNDEKKILVISYSSKELFKSDGSFYDKFLNINSKDLINSRWILISLDNFIPNNLNENIKIFGVKKSFFKYDIFSFIKIIINRVFKYNFSIKKIFHYLNFDTFFSEKISTLIYKELRKNKFETLITPYEAKPYQLYVNNLVKDYDNEILTIGYVHSSLPSLPCEYVFRNGSPDLICVHGSTYKKILKDKLSWPMNKINLIKSLRFKKNYKSMSGKIFLPYKILGKKILLNSFKEFLENAKLKSLEKFSIENHPSMLKSKIHLEFIFNLKNLIDINKNKFSDNASNNQSIFFGFTGAIFEALERGNEVIHFFSDPFFESLNNNIWEEIDIKVLNNNAQKYNLNKKGCLIDFSDESFSLNDVIKKSNKIFKTSII